MTYSPIATLTILSLIVLAICCQMLPLAHTHGTISSAPPSVAHLALLSMSLPSSVLAVVLLLIAVAVFRTAPRFAHDIFYAPSSTLSAHPPAITFATPLQLAFADGILHPKRY